MSARLKVEGPGDDVIFLSEQLVPWSEQEFVPGHPHRLQLIAQLPLTINTPGIHRFSLDLEITLEDETVENFTETRQLLVEKDT